MDKKSKYIIALLLIALVTSVSFFTYAKYISNATGTSTATIAKWAVKLNDNSLDNVTKSFNLPISWATNSHVKSGTVAPGSTGTATVELDPTGTEVQLKYTVNIDTSALSGTGISITDVTVDGNTLGTSGDRSEVIFLPTGGVMGNDQKRSIVISLAWTDDSDSGSSDTYVGTTKTSLNIPVNITVEQDASNLID